MTVDEIKKEEGNETPVVADESTADGDTLTPSRETDEPKSLEEGQGKEVKPGESGTEEDVVDKPDADKDGEDKPAPKPTEKMLTQSQVNELVGKARQEGRESALKDLLLRYGVNDDKELDVIFGKGQTYDDLNDDYSIREKSLREVSAENALLKSHIEEERWDDVKLILQGKGLDVNTQNIEALLPSHPEWRKEVKIAQSETVSPKDVERIIDETAGKEEKAPPTILRKLGNGVTEKAEESEEAQFKKLFGL